MERRSAVLGPIGLVIALALGVTTTSTASAQQTHDHAGTSSPALKLDNGKKWSTDAPLRQGMNKIKTTLAPRLDAAHAGRLSQAQYKEVAKEVTGQVAFIVKNCKLSPAADAVLHAIIAELVAGADAMEGKVKGTAPQAGFVTVVQALDTYGKYFEHAGWQGLKQ